MIGLLNFRLRMRENSKRSSCSSLSPLGGLEQEYRGRCFAEVKLRLRGRQAAGWLILGQNIGKNVKFLIASQ